MGQTKEQYIETVRIEAMREKIQRNYQQEKQVIAGLQLAKKIKSFLQIKEADHFKDNPFLQGNMDALREDLSKKIAKNWSKMDIENQILGRQFRLGQLREEANFYGANLKESA